jgi:hypothetical protein
MIPFMEDYQAFTGDLDLWCTAEVSLLRYSAYAGHLPYAQEFLSMLAGDAEEHAILLYNYFLFITG